MAVSGFYSAGSITAPSVGIAGGTSITSISTATDLGGAGSSDTAIPSQLAVKTYAEAHCPGTNEWVYLHQLAQNTSGGDTVSGVWTQLVINTVARAYGLGSILASNQLTLSAGRYRIRCRKTYNNVPTFRMRLYNVTDGTTHAYGLSNQMLANATGAADLETFIDLVAQKVFEFQYYATTVVTDGLGKPSNIAGTPEIYLRCILEKQASV